MRYHLERKIAGKGSAPDRFRGALRGIALDSDGRLYATGDREVKVFDPDGTLARRFPTARPGLCVTVLGDGRVLVGEAGHVEVFDPAGKLQSTWTDAKRLALVTAIATHGESAWVADARAPSIRRYDLDGKHLLTIGDGTRRRGFAVPGSYLDFCVDAGGVLHVAHNGKHRVERYSSDGKLLGRFGHFGMLEPKDFRGCCNPTNIVVSRSGLVTVAEKASPRVKIYDAAGKLLTVFAEGELDAACKYMDLAVDEDDRLWVADSVRATVLVWAPVDGATKRTVEDRETPAREGAASDG